MKKNLVTILFIAGVFFFASFSETLAFLARPLGGMYLVAPIPGITCPTSTTPGQWTIRPYNLASAGPYLIITTGTKAIPRPGAYFKGNYSTIPLPVCNSGNAPVTTFVIQGFNFAGTQ